MKLNILFVEDDKEWRDKLKTFFDGEKIGSHSLNVQTAETFEAGTEILRQTDFDIVVLDIYKGEPKDGNPKTGMEILKEIQQTVFVPVIFFSGLTKDVENLQSEMVGVVNKGDGLEALNSQIGRTVESRLALLRQQVFSHVSESLRAYFWDTVHSENSIFEPNKIGVPLGYLLLRRLANSLSKENIKTILGDDSIQVEKAHPMEFYIFPTGSGEFEAGEILQKGEDTFVILTPSCDFICDGKRPRKVEDVLLCKATLLTDTPEYKKYAGDKEKFTDNLRLLIESQKGDRFFFLPGTPFLPNLVVDFQRTSAVKYEDLSSFDRVAKLDDPFAQAMVTSFSRHYNRVGYPDIDAAHVIGDLGKEAGLDKFDQET